MPRDNKDFEDDGRTVADMSGVERQRVFIPRLPKKEKQEWEAREENNDEKLSREDRRAYILGSMGAAALVAGIFIFAAFIFICVFLAIYK
ncbi:MAG: hypothetical protein J1E34_10140 [Oscillospiraceae bacterium]|nr:hypothetical protein [Oscillospiraceae bacterium]